MKFLTRKRLLWLVCLVAVAGGVVYALSRPTPYDTRWNGAYRLHDGTLVFVTPRHGDVLRYRLMDGESRALWPVDDDTYEAGAGWAERSPVEVTLQFETDSSGRPSGFSWQHPELGAGHAQKLDLPERFVSFQSGDLALRGKLVLPLEDAGPGPHPVVVLVHGSGRDSAVDSYYNPYLFASHGIATLVYDKRGTGESEGKYNQNFHVLADDVLAAVEWLRSQPEIDATRIHLAGYSQGGWIAPLAASRTEGIRSLLIGYGPMVPITGEDRWGYVYALQEKGFGDDALAEADRINDVLSAIVDHGEDRWDEARTLLDEAEGEPWLEAVKGSDSMLGFVADTKMPWWVLRIVGWWMTRPQEIPFADRLYDPVPTVAALEVPSLWVFGGEDHSMPTGWTIDELEKLEAEGRPIEIEVYPEADHGILLFEDDDGRRRYVGYPESYLPLQVEWLRSHSAP